MISAHLAAILFVPMTLCNALPFTFLGSPSTTTDDEGPETDRLRIVREALRTVDDGSAQQLLAAAYVSGGRRAGADPRSHGYKKSSHSDVDSSLPTRERIVSMDDLLQQNDVYGLNRNDPSDRASPLNRLRHTKHRSRSRIKESRQPGDRFAVESYSDHADESSCNGEDNFLCPSLHPRFGVRQCVKRISLCDDKDDCPGGEDEDPVACLFYKATSAMLTRAWDLIEDINQQFNQLQRRPRPRHYRRHRFRRRHDDGPADDEL